MPVFILRSMTKRPVAVLVAADRFPGDAVEIAESIVPAAHQDRVHRRCRHAELASDLHRPHTLAPPQPHDPTQHYGASCAGHRCPRDRVCASDVRRVCGPSLTTPAD